MCHKYDNNIGVLPILGDIRDKEILSTVFGSFRPDVVLHAAAYKHVPMQEQNPWEAVQTNIQGTINLVECSEVYGVERFVLVSTDKAVNPTTGQQTGVEIGYLYQAMDISIKNTTLNPVASVASGMAYCSSWNNYECVSDWLRMENVSLTH